MVVTALFRYQTGYPEADIRQSTRECAISKIERKVREANPTTMWDTLPGNRERASNVGQRKRSTKRMHNGIPTKIGA